MSTVSLFAGLAVAAAVLLLWPPAPLRRLDAPASGWALPAWLRPRPDGLSPRLLALLGGATAVGVALFLSSYGLLIALPVGVVAGAVTALGLGRLEPAAAVRRREQLLAQVPHALRLIAACLGAGLPLRRAVEAVARCTGGPVAIELDRVLAQIAVGVAERDAWLSLRNDAVLGSLARDLARSVESGTAVQAILVQRAAELQSDHRAAVEARAKAVGVRTVLPLTLCFLPAFFLLGVVPVVAGMLATILR